MPFRRRSTTNRRQRGQSTVELALMLLPLLMLSLLAVDGGGLFLAWIGMNGVSREAANFAAVHPTAWGTPGDATAQARYASIIRNGAAADRCALADPAATPVPMFPTGTTVGAAGTVNLAVAQTRCRYTFITPLINQMSGGGIWLTTTTSIPIRAGTIAGVPVSSSIPIPSSTPTPVPTTTPTPSTSPTPSPTPACDPVPEFVNKVLRGNAAAVWAAARFTGSVSFSPDNINAFPTTSLVGGQSLVAGAVVPCTSNITLTKN